LFTSYLDGVDSERAKQKKKSCKISFRRLEKGKTGQHSETPNAEITIYPRCNGVRRGFRERRSTAKSQKTSTKKKAARKALTIT